MPGFAWELVLVWSTQQQHSQSVINMQAHKWQIKEQKSVQKTNQEKYEPVCLNSMFTTSISFSSDIQTSSRHVHNC